MIKNKNKKTKRKTKNEKQNTSSSRCTCNHCWLLTSTRWRNFWSLRSWRCISIRWFLFVTRQHSHSWATFAHRLLIVVFGFDSSRSPKSNKNNSNLLLFLESIFKNDFVDFWWSFVARCGAGANCGALLDLWQGHCQNDFRGEQSSQHKRKPSNLY